MDWVVCWKVIVTGRTELFELMNINGVEENVCVWNYFAVGKFIYV